MYDNIANMESQGYIMFIPLPRLLMFIQQLRVDIATLMPIRSLYGICTCIYHVNVYNKKQPLMKVNIPDHGSYFIRFFFTRIAIPPKNTLPETNIANENPHLSW